MKRGDNLRKRIVPHTFVEEFICAEPCRHQGVRLCFFIIGYVT